MFYLCSKISIVKFTASWFELVTNCSGFSRKVILLRETPLFPFDRPNLCALLLEVKGPRKVNMNHTEIIIHSFLPGTVVGGSLYLHITHATQFFLYFIL